MVTPIRITYLLAAGLLAILHVEAANAAGEPTAVPAANSDWRVDCTNNTKTLDCRAFLEVVEKNNHQVITAFTVRYPTETKKPVMMLQLPLGILVSEAVFVSVDAGAAERAPIQTCTQTGCFVGAPMTDAMINAMLTGKQLKVVFYNVNKQPVTVTMPLAGFSIAYGKIKG